MKKLLLAVLLFTLATGALAATAPVSVTTVTPVVDAQCSLAANPANTVMFVAATGRLFWCNPVPRGAPSVTRWQVLVINGAGTNGTYGVLLDVNVDTDVGAPDNSTCENPPGNKAGYCFTGDQNTPLTTPASIKPKFTRPGMTPRELLFTDGGAYGPITCTAGVCTLNINSINGTHLQLGGDVIGDLMRYDGTNYVRFPRGTTLQVLRTNAAATDIEWGGAAGGGDNVLVNNTNVTDPDLHGSPGEGGLPQGVDIEVVNCAGLDSPGGKACLAAGDVNFRYAPASIEDGDINNSAGIAFRKVLGSTVDSWGITLWGDPALLTVDTGDDVCTTLGNKNGCKYTYAYSGAVDAAPTITRRTCAFTQTTLFQVWCK